MNGLEQAFRLAIEELETLGFPYALVGGFAVGVRSDPRLTRDVDLAVAVADDSEAEAVTRALMASGYDVESTVEHEFTGRLATVRLRSPIDAGVLVDLLFASCGIEPEITAAAERIVVIPDLEVPVAAVGHLIAMKLLARDDRQRPADADDLVGLAAIATSADWQAASSAVELIHQRETNRGRDLRAALDELRSNPAAGER